MLSGSSWVGSCDRGTLGLPGELGEITWKSTSGCASRAQHSTCRVQHSTQYSTAISCSTCRQNQGEFLPQCKMSIPSILQWMQWKKREIRWKNRRKGRKQEAEGEWADPKRVQGLKGTRALGVLLDRMLTKHSLLSVATASETTSTELFPPGFVKQTAAANTQAGTWHSS